MNKLKRFGHWLMHTFGFDGGCGVATDAHGTWRCKSCGQATADL